MLDVRRTLYVAERYPQLQGLRLIPVAVCFLGSAAWRAGLLAWLPGIAGRGARSWFYASLAIALVVSIRIGAHYQRHIGATRPRVTRRGALTLTTSFVTFVMLASLPTNAWNVSMAVFYVAFAMAFVGLVDDWRRHYLAIAGACLLFAIASRVGVSHTVRSVWLDLLIGLGILVAGVGDHLALRRVLQASEREGVLDVRTARGSHHHQSPGA